MESSDKESSNREPVDQDPSDGVAKRSGAKRSGAKAIRSRAIRSRAIEELSRVRGADYSSQQAASVLLEPARNMQPQSRPPRFFFSFRRRKAVN